LVLFGQKRRKVLERGIRWLPTIQVGKQQRGLVKTHTITLLGRKMGKKVKAFGKVSVVVPIYNIETELYIGEGSIPSTLPVDTSDVNGCVQVVKRDGFSKVVIWLGKMEWTTWDMGLLAHEMVHVATKIFGIIGVEGTVDEEIMAYLVGYLVREYSKKIHDKWSL
jgi:hypothetical protein